MKLILKHIKLTPLKYRSFPKNFRSSRVYNLDKQSSSAFWNFSQSSTLCFSSLDQISVQDTAPSSKLKFITIFRQNLLLFTGMESIKRTTIGWMVLPMLINAQFQHIKTTLMSLERKCLVRFGTIPITESKDSTVFLVDLLFTTKDRLKIF